MMIFTRRIAAVLITGLVLAVLAGCAIRAQQLSSQPLITRVSIPNERQTSKSFLIYPAEDRRGGTFGTLIPTAFIPGVNLFHVGSTNNYPETSGLLRSSNAVTVGSLPSAFPYLLAEMMRLTRFTTNVTPVDQINTKVKLSSFDFVIMAKIIDTKFEQHINMVPCAFLGIVGVPYIFVDGTIKFEVSVYRSRDMNRPLMTKTYTHHDNKAVGLYYNHTAHFDIFIYAIETLLAQAVQDISMAIR